MIYLTKSDEMVHDVFPDEHYNKSNSQQRAEIEIETLLSCEW